MLRSLCTFAQRNDRDLAYRNGFTICCSPEMQPFPWMQDSSSSHTPGFHRFIRRVHRHICKGEPAVEIQEIMRFGLVLALLLCVLLSGQAIAEEAQTPAGGYRHWLTDLAPPLSGVETQHWFPDHPGARFTVGGPVDVVLGLHNSAGEAFNITHIAGSINAPQAFQYYVQNFTLQPYNSYLKPGEQASLQYTFKPDNYLPVQEWQLSLTAYLRTERSFFCNTFFNQTVDVVDRPHWVDTQLLFLAFIGMSVLGVIALFSWDSISNLTVVKRVNKRTRKPTSRPAAGPKVVEPAGTSEWLKGTNYGQEGRSRLKKESSRKLTSSTPTSPQ